MSGDGWARRDVVRGLAFAALACVSVAPATPGDAAGPDPTGGAFGSERGRTSRRLEVDHPPGESDGRMLTSGSADN